MASLHVSIPDNMREWIEARTESGQYANNSDYIRDLIRRDQQKAEKFAMLQAAITEGLESGAPKSFEREEFSKRMLDSLKDA